MGGVDRDIKNREKQPNQLYFPKRLTYFEKVVKMLISKHDFVT